MKRKKRDDDIEDSSSNAVSIAGRSPFEFAEEILSFLMGLFGGLWWAKKDEWWPLIVLVVLILMLKAWVFPWFKNRNR